MDRSNFGLKYRSVVIGLAGTTLAVLGFAPSLQAQILYDTAPYSAGSPGSTAAAIAAFDSLPQSSSGYGCQSVPTLDGLSNQNKTTAVGAYTDLAYHEEVVFTVPPNEVGTWSFRWGVDFGWGGTLLLDGVELQSNWNDMWWDGAWTVASQHLQGSANLTAGTHVIDVFGFENCCDGLMNAQFLAPGSSTWQDVNTTNLNIVPETCGSPALLLTASATPSPVLDGAQLTYTFFYESTGTATATGAALTTMVPVNTTFVSASNGGAFDGSTGQVNWSLGDLGIGVSGSVTLTVAVQSPLADGTVLTDTATLSAPGATSSTATTNVTVSNALLTLTSTSAPNPVQAGAQLTVTLGYADSGSGPAPAATITDLLPANTSFVSASNGGTYDSTSNTVTFNLGDLAMGSAGSVSYVVQVAAPLANGTLLTDMASLSAMNNATVTASSTATVASAPALTLGDSPAPNPVAADSMLVYTLSYANGGTDAANGVAIVWSVPANVTFQTASANGAYDSTSNQVTWTIGSVPAGTSGSVTVTVLVASPIANGTVLTDSASLTATNAATVMANTMVTVTSAPVLTLTDTGAPNPVAAGAQLTYTLAYGNAGTDSAAATTIVAPIPANTTFVSGTGGSYDAGLNQVTFTLGSVPAGMSGTVTFTVAVASPLANNTSLAASATLSATGVASVTAMTTTTVDAAPTLSLTNTGAPNPVLAGSQLTYTLAFANNGTDAAHGAALSDQLPAAVGFISASNGGTYDSTSNTVSWSLGDVAAGSSGSLTLIVLVSSNAAAGILSDTATLTASNISTGITATAMTTVNALTADAGPDAGPDAGAPTGAGGSSSTGTGGSGATGAGGAGTTGAGGSSSTGTGGSGATGAGGAGTTGAGGASSTGTGGNGATGAGGAGTTGAGGTSSTGTGGNGATGAGGAGTTGAGGTSSTGTGGNGATGAGGAGTTGAGGTSSAGTGGTSGSGGAGAAAGSNGAGGASSNGTGGNGGAAGTAGTGGHAGTGGAGAGGHAGTTGGTTSTSGAVSGCDCAVGSGPSPGGWLGIMMVVGIALGRRGRKSRR